MDELLVAGPSVLDEELLTLGPAMEIPYERGIEIWGGGEDVLFQRRLRRTEVRLRCRHDLGDLLHRSRFQLTAEDMHVLSEPGYGASAGGAVILKIASGRPFVEDGHQVLVGRAPVRR